MFKATIQNRH